MKEIFDWLREQIKSGKREQHNMLDVTWNNSIKMCLQVVDEAEAKWEAECCEKDFAQRIKTVIPLLEVNMLYGTVSLLKDLADELGIKISEVE